MPAKEKRDLISFIKDLIQYQRDRTNQPGFPSWSCMIQKKAGFLQRRKERENHQGTGRVRRSSKLSLSFDAESQKEFLNEAAAESPRASTLFLSSSFMAVFFFCRRFLWTSFWSDTPSRRVPPVCVFAMSSCHFQGYEISTLFLSSARMAALLEGTNGGKRERKKIKRRELNDQKISLPFFDSTAMLAVVQASGVASPSGATGS